jgi:hypothetical protein
VLNKKKGQLEPLNWLFNLLRGAAGLILVLFIVIGLVSVVWNARKKTQMDDDFKHILDAAEVLMNDFDDGKIYGNANIPVPIASETAFNIVFFPAAGAPVKPPDKCRGQNCMCLYYKVDSSIKETCKLIEVKTKCVQETCGKELCAGPYKEFTLKKGNAINVQISCTDKGSQFSVEAI